MKSRALIPVFFLFLAVALPAYPQVPAQPADRPRLTLPQAIATALAHNAAIVASRHRVDGADQRIAMARSGFFPQLNAAETYTRTTSPMWAFGTKLNQEVIALRDFDPTRLNDPDAIDNFATVLSANWPVFDAGQTWYGWQQAKLDHQAALQGADRLRQEVIAMTVQAYTAVVLAREHLETIALALASARSHLDMVQARFQSGFVVKSDLLRAQVHIARLTQQELEAQSRAAVAMAGLNALMGRPTDAVDDLEPVLNPIAGISGDIATWTAKALDQRSDLKAIRLKEQIAEAEVRKARAAHLPSVNLMGNYEINTERFAGSADNYTVGAMVNLNLFSGDRLSARQREAAAVLAEARAMAGGLVQQIQVQIHQAFTEAQSAAARIGVAQTAVDQAGETIGIVANRYQAGLLTIVDLLDAETALHQARSAQIEAAHDLVVARAGLLLAAGALAKDFQ